MSLVHTGQTRSGFIAYSFFLLLFDYYLSMFNLGQINKI